MMSRLSLLLFLSVPLGAQEGWEQLRVALEKQLAAREVKPLAEEPDWAAREGAAIFRFVQFTDIHHPGGPHDENLERAIGFANSVLKPDWVVVTGDNISAPQTEQHEREVKEILEARLACPYHMVKGNHDERVFEPVFGSSRWSFDCGGVHFLAAAIDRDAREDGVGVLDASTYRFIEDDVAQHASEPLVFFMHENLVPPDFLDAARLGLVLSLHRNLVGTVTGHLHHDIEERVGQVTHIVAPSLGLSPSHGIKLYGVHEDHITVKTYEVVGGRYAFANKWQRIAFPSRLHADATRGKAVTAWTEADPLPTATTEGLNELDALGRSIVGGLYRLVTGRR